MPLKYNIYFDIKCYYDIIFLVIFMVCKKCNKEFEDGQTFCPYCGQDQNDIVLTGDRSKDAAAQTDYRTIGGLCIIISILLPPIGLIMSIIYLSTMKNNDKMGRKEEGKKRFIISIIISLAWIVIPMLIGIVRLIISALMG